VRSLKSPAPMVEPKLRSFGWRSGHAGASLPDHSLRTQTMMEYLRIGRAAYFYERRRKISAAAIDTLSETFAAAKERRLKTCFAFAKSVMPARPSPQSASRTSARRRSSMTRLELRIRSSDF
jgi:hypothetical protein